jgi:hypothetical protein
MYRTSKNKMVKRVGVSTIVAAGVIVTGVGIAGASSPAVHKASITKASNVVTPLSSTSVKQARSSTTGMMRAPGGLVTAVSAGSITVRGLQGTSSTYTIDSSTKVTKDRLTATVAELAVGEHVRVITSSTSSTTAAGIEIQLARVAGQVVSVNGDSITISDRDGFYRTISVSSSTVYSKGGVSAALSDVTSGWFIVAEGTVDANHTTLNANAVGIGLASTPVTPGTGAPQGMGPQGVGGGFAGMGASLS